MQLGLHKLGGALRGEYRQAAPLTGQTANLLEYLAGAVAKRNVGLVQYQNGILAPQRGDTAKHGEANHPLLYTGGDGTAATRSGHQVLAAGLYQGEAGIGTQFRTAMLRAVDDTHEAVCLGELVEA